MDKVTEHLIEGCRRGDRSSQLKLYKQYAQRLYIACLRIVGNSSEAEEAMQDSFLKIGRASCRERVLSLGVW